jgi:branched-chain amino acid transport system substrate-binding protein
MLPVTGDLAFIGPPEINGAELAIADINEAGGVLGVPVEISQGDSGDLSTDVAQQTSDRLLAEGVDAVIGASSSAVTKTFLDKVLSANVIVFSPAATSDEFTTYEDNGLMFRTAPPDVMQGQVLANKVIEDGHQNAAVLFRQEAYGQGLAESFQTNFEAAGGTIAVSIPYAPNAETYDAEVDQIVQADPDAILVIGFAESATILTVMNERGVGPLDKAVYGTDGNEGIGSEMSDPSIISGFKASTPSVDLSTITDFTDRLDEQAAISGADNAGVYNYGAETYDAIVIIALAAETAGSDNPSDVAAEINDVTREGEKCTTFADCLALVQAGTDIDYDGVGGPYDFVDAGEPSSATFRISTYAGEASRDAAQDEYIFAAS